MEEILTILRSLANPTAENVTRYIDIAVVAFLLYRVLLLVRKRRAYRIVIGIVTFLVLLQLSSILKLNTLHWILDRATVLGPVALVILFLPELRQSIEELGRVSPVGWIQSYRGDQQIFAEQRTILEVVSATAELASQRCGALIVIQRTQPLDDLVSSGVQLNADLSSSLLSSIFYGENPLHDGAVIIRGDKLLAAACRLPLSETDLERHLHMRHRAAVGASEQFDCVAIVVSEERGRLSVAVEGSLQVLNGPHELEAALREYLRSEPSETVAKARRRMRFNFHREPSKKRASAPVPDVEEKEEVAK